MKYYSDEDMKKLREAFEKTVLDWPKVTTKKMFGCPCYQADKKLFAFIVTDGVVITQLSEDDFDAVSNKFDAEPFSTGKRTVSKWLKVPLLEKKDLKKIIEYVNKSYKTALKKED
jgi:hypothetical protein